MKRRNLIVGMAVALVCGLIALAVVSIQEDRAAIRQWKVTQTCDEVTALFLPDSQLTHQEQRAAWADYARKDFEWRLTVASVRQDEGFGIVDYRCAGSADAFAPVRVFYADDYVANSSLESGHTLVVKAQLNTRLTPGAGIVADATIE